MKYMGLGAICGGVIAVLFFGGTWGFTLGVAYGVALQWIAARGDT
jgi:hypothetical protein